MTTRVVFLIITTNDEIHNHLNGLAKEIGWKETLIFIYVKATDKGLHIPNKSPTIIFSLDSDLRVMTCKELPPLVMSLAIYDYTLYNYRDREDNTYYNS